MTEIQWATPPATAILNGNSGGRYGAFSAALRGRPGEWAIMPREGGTPGSAMSAASNIRAGKTKGFEPRGAFETAVDDTTVYVRFVGKPGEDSARESEEAFESSRDVSDGDDETGPTGAQVRAWAVSQGLEPRPGRLPAELWRAYEAAHSGGQDSQ